MEHANGIRSMMTDHAMVRAQQRGLSIEDLDFVYRYGSHVYDHNGARIWTMGAKRLRALAKRLPSVPPSRLEKIADVYVVESLEGSIATVVHRYKRLPNRG